MNIERTVTTTTPRFCVASYKLPTVELRVESPEGATAGDLVEFHKRATPALMHDAHRVAALLWAKNADGRKIDIEPQDNGVAWVTVEPMGSTEEETETILGLMRSALDVTPQA
jgi:hypothetical protein